MLLRAHFSRNNNKKDIYITIMKSTRSWSIIIGITIVSCAFAAVIIYYLGWWNLVAIICIAMLVYAMISER